MKNYLFTSESVTEGHPDKICDTIADKILDEYLKIDENSRVAIDVMASNNRINVAGQVTSSANVNIENLARKTLREIGYTSDETGIDCDNCIVQVNVTKQSENIANMVNGGGAGDQGIMFGYATNETENYMPLAIQLAHNLAKRLTNVRKQNIISNLCPDGKTQVTVEYEGNKPKRIDTIIISAQHSSNKDIHLLKDEIMEQVIFNVVPKNLLDNNTKYFINHKGEFIIGGPKADTGLTGRKIIMDTYGGYAKHGGGAFSGKDATKVDRSAAYMLRHIAKNIVANGLAEKCELQVSYGIGIKEAISINVNTFGTNSVSESEILDIIKSRFSLVPTEIIKYLNLNKPIFASTTNYGHFGKDYLPWEKVIKF